MRRFSVYDSMSRTVRVFAPIQPPRVGLFVCGLTPYDEAHIGHARTFVFFDVVARALTRWGYRVFSVQNVTNLDDKIIARAAERGEEPLALAERHFLSWQVAAERLGIRSVNYFPRATDYVPEIIAQIQQLIDRGYAYPSRGSVYYELAKFPAYGALSGQRTEALRPGARVEVDPAKRSPGDFVIWKAATPGEPSWESPWGPGRPGWHIEDTAITLRLFGPRYDLHGGGLDLIFPHHESEIALAEGATGVAPLVNYWMHGGLLNMGGEKMSKSLGNVYSLREALDEFGPAVLRFFYLNAQYRSPLEFVRGPSLTEAREAYARLALPADRIAEVLEREGPERGGEDAPTELVQRAEDLVERLDVTLADDFNTREAIALLFGWTGELAERLDRLATWSGEALTTLRAPYDWGRETLGLFERRPTGRAGAWARIVPIALAARARARTRGDFTEADRIRDELRAAGVRLEDDASGTRWEFVAAE
jgi:cysteinyl-tRNA synthetase